MNGLFNNLLMSYFGTKAFDPYYEYFYVEPLETGSIYIMSNGFTQNPKVEYSTDKINWTEAQTYVVNTLDRVYIRRKKDSWHHTSQGIGDNLNLPMRCNVGGNILSLIYGDEFNGQKVFPEGSSWNFDGLFRVDNQIGNKIVDASKLLLPTNVTESCYLSMFQYCAELIAVPELPATTLADACYYSMFSNCTSLTTVPELPATTLSYRCYEAMFYNCTGLTTVPSDLLPATTLAQECYSRMFYLCTSLTSAPVLPATTLQNSCYSWMFAYTALTTAPELPATTLVTDCYDDMFQHCSSLNYVKCLATNPQTSNTTSWLANVSPTGTFVKTSGTEWDRSGNGIPSGWTVQNA